MNLFRSILVLLVSGFVCGEAILSGNQANETDIGDKTSSSQKIDSFKLNETTPAKETNNTFYYEANAFLLNKNEQPQVKRDSPIEPASISSTSGRNGRMLDLDALVGDFAASQLVKAKSQTGNRQSRYLPSDRALEVGNGKKLHIQGFIPIVGVKDVNMDESSSSNGADLDQLQDQPQQASSVSKKNNEELPYSQSSIGHASFVPGQQSAQLEAKFSGTATVVDTLRKPLKKLMRYGEAQQHASNNFRSQQAACLCVPFYMCKNGFLSESSLAGSHIQQMIQGQQHQIAYPSAMQAAMRAQPKAAHLTIAPTPKELYTQTASSQAQFATLSAQVDERSLDREIITMAPLTRSADEQQTGINQTSDSSEIQPNLAANNFEGDALNLTNSELNQASEYSQEILGRMLGIKSIGSPKLSSGDSSNGPAGVCGLLRTCCQIPAAHLISGGHNQESATSELNNLPLQGQTSFSGASNNPLSSNRYSSHSYQNNQLEMTRTDQQQQPILSAPRYQAQSTNALQRGIPYGFPATQISRMQALNGPDQLAVMSTALAHRSNLFPQTSSNRFRVMSPSQAGDYKRAPQQMQQVPFSLQQQSAPVLHQSMGGDELSSQAIRVTSSAAMAPHQGQVLNEGLGTRKILEGRCGLRQSAGINGRVQNLQYQENSAEFGEYPAQAAILKRISGTDSMFVCGGTLISQYWVATAAHCIKKHSINELKVRLGEWDVHRDDEFYPYIEKGIRDLVVHSEFVPGNLVNDLALLRLDSPADPSLPHVNPACLPTIGESFTNQKCWVTGWGKDSFGHKGSFQTVLQEVELPVVGQTECESALRQTRLGTHYRLHSGFICAGGEGGKDACEGDGGSGLYCMQDGLIKVAGLVSWGIGCGQQGVPGVYVNLAHYRPWIENIISIDEDIYSRNFNNSMETDKTTVASV